MKNTSQTKLDGRFAGILGQEYEKLLKAMPHIPHIENEVARLANQVLPSPVKSGKIRMILDLGCGTGLTTLALRKYVHYSCIVGVDKEPAMLKQYVNNIVEGKKSYFLESGVVVKAFRSDVLAFLKRCNDSGFDAVVSAFVLHNIPKAKRAEIIKEIARVLRPGGIFVNGDKIAPDDKPLHDKYLMQQFAKFVQVYPSPEDAAYCIEWIEHYARDNEPDLRYTETEVSSSLKAVGFKSVKIIDRHCMDAIAVAKR